MARRMNRLIRSMAPSAALLILLAHGTAAAEAGRQAAGTPSAAGREVLLLKDADYFPALVEGIRHARQEIALSVFFFKTMGMGNSQPELVLAHLLEAARRGVRIEAVVESGPDGDNVSRDNRETAKRLQKGGIRVCLDAPDRTTHAKLVVIDRRYLFVGSHNLTQSALKYNHEVSVRIDSPPLAEEALAYLKSLCP
jgi:phosphatidylserine/phosphatidylglycerophosphate/cardiolipin synthase-like enzyme